jgi:ABC-type transporter Mla maintaining outer membrane lipid asymmetry permease subunit MlaE
MAASDKAVSKADAATEKRFDSVNEFRNAMKDQQSTFADKTQTDFRLGAIERSIEKVGGVSLGVTISAAVLAGLISAIGSVVLIETALRHR